MFEEIRGMDKRDQEGRRSREVKSKGALWINYHITLMSVSILLKGKTLHN